MDMRRTAPVPTNFQKNSTRVVCVVCIAASIFVKRVVGQSNGTAMQVATSTQSRQAESQEVRRLRQAAEQGNAQAQYDLGDRYYEGNGVVKDPRQAFEWYFKAA